MVNKKMKKVSNIISSEGNASQNYTEVSSYSNYSGIHEGYNTITVEVSMEGWKHCMILLGHSLAFVLKNRRHHTTVIRAHPCVTVVRNNQTVKPEPKCPLTDRW